MIDYNKMTIEIR